MENYYILFNYTNQSVGFNGYYYIADSEIDKPDVPGPNKVPLWAVLLISTGVVAIVLSICICLYIKQKNRTLKEGLTSYDKLESS